VDDLAAFDAVLARISADYTLVDCRTILISQNIALGLMGCTRREEHHHVTAARVLKQSDGVITEELGDRICL
jgi:hypothetical protein